MQSTDIQGRLRQTRAQVIFQALLFLVWTKDTVWAFAVLFIRGLPIVGQIYNFVIPAMIVVAVILSLPYLLRHARALDLLFCIGCVIMALFSYVLYAENQPYIEDQLFTIIFSCLPMYLIGVGCLYEECRNVLYGASLFSLMVMLIYQLSLVTSGNLLMVYNMSAAYKLFPSVMFLILTALEKKKLLHWLVAIGAIVLSFTYGTRGPILAIFILLAIGIYVLVIRSKKTYARIVFLIVAVALLVLFFLEKYSLMIVEQFRTWFGEIGFSTRIFDYIVNGDIAESSSREVLLNTVSDALKERPIRGYGIMGDRVLLDGAYCHNIVWEFWCDFGFVIGSLFLLGIVVLVVRALVKTRETKSFLFVITIAVMSIVKLLLSNSYLIDPYFFFMIGVCVSCARGQTSEQRREVL